MTPTERLLFGFVVWVGLGISVPIFNVSSLGWVGVLQGALMGIAVFLVMVPNAIAEIRNIENAAFIRRTEGLEVLFALGGLMLYAYNPASPWSYVIWIVAVLFWLFRLTLAVEGSSGKQCPDCAETVKSEALKCKHCGYRFEQI